MARYISTRVSKRFQILTELYGGRNECALKYLCAHNMARAMTLH